MSLNLCNACKVISIEYYKSNCLKTAVGMIDTIVRLLYNRCYMYNTSSYMCVFYIPTLLSVKGLDFEEV